MSPISVLMILSHSAKIPSRVRIANVSSLRPLTFSLVARDQEIDIPSQLGLGVRLLQAQAHALVFLFRPTPDPL